MFHALGHYRAYGVALLVGLSCSFSFADFQAHDSQALQQILYTLLGSGTTNGDSIWALTLQQKAILNSIDSKVSSVSTISSDVATIKRYLDYNLNGDTATDSMSFHDFIAEFNRKFYQGVDRYGSSVVANPATVSVFSGNGYSPFVEPGSSFDNSRTAQMAVTNRAETYWLEKIYNELHGGFSHVAGVSGYTTYQYGNAIFPSEIYNDWNDYLRGDLSLQTFLDRWGAWNIYPLMFSNLIDFDNLSSFEQERYENYLTYQCFLDSDIAQALMDYLPYDSLGPIFNRQYGNAPLLEFFQASGLDMDSLNVTNFFTADGSIENTDNAFTNSDTSVFSKFARSFLPSGMFAPDEVNTNLFEYVDSDISETPSFNPIDISGNGGLRSSSSDFDYDFDDSTGDYDYNLINPLKTATDTVQHDTDLDNKFEQLAGLVNQRITSIFQNPLNTISSQPARWQASLIDKDMNQTEDYVDPQYSKSSDGVQFVCWCCESMMFFGFFSFCVRRSLRVQQARDVASAI